MQLSTPLLLITMCQSVMMELSMQPVSVRF